PGYNYPQLPSLGVLLFVVFGTLMGVLFGWLRLASNSVLPPTIAHASLNAIAGLPFIFLVKGVDAAVAGALWSPIGWLVLLAAIAILYRTGALRRGLRSTVGEWAGGTRGGTLRRPARPTRRPRAGPGPPAPAPAPGAPPPR